MLLYLRLCKPSITYKMNLFLIFCGSLKIYIQISVPNKGQIHCVMICKDIYLLSLYLPLFITEGRCYQSRQNLWFFALKVRYCSNDESFNEIIIVKLWWIHPMLKKWIQKGCFTYLFRYFKHDFFKLYLPPMSFHSNYFTTLWFVIAIRGLL